MTSEAAVSDGVEEREEGTSAARRIVSAGQRFLIYGALLIWTFIALFPLYWTFSTSFKLGKDVTQGHLIPWVDFVPKWKGWQSLGLSPDTIFTTSDVRDEFLKKFVNSVICSIGASALAVVIGALAAYGLSRFDLRFGRWRNQDLSFFFLSQLILPPVVLALPFLVLYKELALLDTRLGLSLIYTLMVLPIVIWVMRDQFDTIPPEMEQAALVDGCSIWAPSSGLSCRLRFLEWSQPSFFRWSCAGTSTSSRLSSPASTPRRCPSWSQARPDRKGSTGGLWPLFPPPRSPLSS